MKRRYFFTAASIIASAAAYAQISLSATEAVFIPGVTDNEANANKNGVYPVEITWTEYPDASEYTVARSLYEDSDFQLIAVIPAPEQRFLDVNQEALPNTVYYYKVTAVNKDHSPITAAAVPGWGALTYSAYMKAYNQNVVSSHSKLILMHKRRALAKLGTEKAEGSLSGSLSYKTRIRGFSGIVTMKYENYSDSAGWILNGYTNTKANIRANGRMFSSVQCTGMYPGIIYYDNIEIKKGTSNGGSYGVEPAGFARSELPWNIVDAEVEEIEDEE